MNNPNYINEASQVFLKAVAPKDVSEHQARDMKICFSTGATWMFEFLLKIMDEGQEPTEKDLAIMALLQLEVNAFKATMRAKN